MRRCLSLGLLEVSSQLKKGREGSCLGPSGQSPPRRTRPLPSEGPGGRGSPCGHTDASSVHGHSFAGSSPDPRVPWTLNIPAPPPSASRQPPRGKAILPVTSPTCSAVQGSAPTRGGQSGCARQETTHGCSGAAARCTVSEAGFPACALAFLRPEDREGCAPADSGGRRRP